VCSSDLASFFAEQSGVYAAFVERQSPTHLVLRGQGDGQREADGGGKHEG
jgi:hypothetical protein